MYLSYGGHRPQRIMQYRCKMARVESGAPDCQTVGGRRIDATVVEVFLEAAGPAGVEVAQGVEEERRWAHEALAGSWRLAIEKAEYEAHRRPQGTEAAGAAAWGGPSAQGPPRGTPRVRIKPVG